MSELDDVLTGQAPYAMLEGDWRAVLLPLLTDGAIDVTITDPPYNARTHERARSLKDGGSDIPINFAALTDFSFVPDLLRVSKRWVLAFCAMEQLGEYERAAGEERWIRSQVWHRTDGTPQISGDRPAQAAEGIATMHRAGPKAWNGGGKRGIYSYGVERRERQHPTQKPIGLMIELVELFTDPGDLVLDPYCGSATTGIACLRLGRGFVGCELNPEYTRISRERLAAESRGGPPSIGNQISLFG